MEDVQALQAPGHGGSHAIERGKRTRRDAQRVSSGRRDAADLALEDRISERDRTHRPHLAALQRRRHEAAEGRRTSRLDDQIVAASAEPVGGVGHLEAIEIAWGASEHRRQRMRSGLSGQQRACHGTADRPAPDEADLLHLPRVQRRGRPRPAQHERAGDADRGMASRIEIATDAVDLGVTDCDVLTAPAQERASMDAEYSARRPVAGIRVKVALTTS